MATDLIAERTVAPRRAGPARWIAAAVGTALVVLVVLLATRKPAVSKIAESPLVGRTAPEIVGANLDGGDTVRLSTMRGRFVLVNFFATWCVPCRREHDDLVRFAERHRGEGDVRLLQVVYDDEPARVLAYRKRSGGSWPLVDDEGRIALSYGVRGLPESFLVDPSGTVLARLVGGVTDGDLEALLADAKR